MDYSLEVYDPANAVHQGTLAKRRSIGWSEDLRGPGSLVFSLSLKSTADRALLPPGVPKVIRLRKGGVDREAFVVRDQPAQLVTDDGKPFLRYQCEQHISRLGYSRGGATLWPHGGLLGLQQSPRWFGPMGWDFLERVGIPEPTTGGPTTRENWQDPRAERFVFNTRALYRRMLAAGDPSEVGSPSRMWLTAASWTDVRVWLDGVELSALNSGVGDRQIKTFDVVYDGEQHIIFFDCVGSPPAGRENSLVWTWAILTDDPSGEPNQWGNMENRLFTTFNSATYSGPTAPTPPYWQAWEDYADGTYPGVNNGYVSQLAITEAQARGLLPGVTLGFDEYVDADGAAWEHEYVHAFEPQRLGQLHDQLGAWLCEPHLTPANVLRLYQHRGVDRGGTPDVGISTVTIATPRSLSATGRAPVATRYLFQTEAAFDELKDDAAELALGAALEDFVTLGNDVHPHTGAGALALQLAEDARVRNDLEVALPSSIVPGEDVFLGDIVQTIAASDLSLGDARITSFRTEVDDDTGRADHFAFLEPA